MALLAAALNAIEYARAKLDLPYPTFIDYAVAGNRLCGVCPPALPPDLHQYCDQAGSSRQG